MVWQFDKWSVSIFITVMNLLDERHHIAKMTTGKPEPLAGEVSLGADRPDFLKVSDEK